MIRMKAKSVLLSIMLLLASCIFFACKEPVTINVENIAFTEQSISLLVGEEYIPTVKILPSYATTRSYTLISTDVTALKVDGGTITALKAAEGVKLKVVSDENKNINDVISVNIYNEATELATPTELSFNGDRFTFVGKDNSNAYELNINGVKLNIGNNTEYNFANIVGKVDNLYNQVVTCKVKALGDGKIFKDSAYSESISFINIAGVQNAYVQDEVLYFDAIKDVASYTINILAEGKYVEPQTLNNPLFEQKALSLDISSLTDSINGAEYEVQIIPNIANYNAPETVGVFGGETVSLDYKVLAKVKNLLIVDKMLSWGFVDNAQSYTVQAFKDGVLVEEFEDITSNELKLDYKDAGEYYCKVIANASGLNIATGKEYSDPLHFDILDAPQISTSNNIVSWTDIVGADGYLVTIKDEIGEIIVNQKFVLQNIYDVSNFIAGTYYIEVIACGNGENGNGAKAIISSDVSKQTSWTILNKLQSVEILDEKLYWKDLDENSLRKHNVRFDNVDIVLTQQDYGTEYSYNQETGLYCYDLSGHNFEPGKYDVVVQNIGEGAIFDSVVNTKEIIKLAESEISGLASKQFSISLVADACEYIIGIYKANDLNNAILMLDNISGNRFVLDDSMLNAGSYVAKVFVLGNGINVFDAEEPTTSLSFEKLAVPTIDVDKTNFKVVVDKDNLIKNESYYRLFENNRDLGAKFVDNQYELASLIAGNYAYTAQAVGDNAMILDSAVTLIADARQVKKLATPTINFDKEELKFEVSCGADESFVDYYTMTLNDKPLTVANNVAHCGGDADIKDAGNYEAKVYANPLEVAEYNLIIGSAIQSYAVVKLGGACDFSISNGMLIVTPHITLAGSGYSLGLRITNAENSIVLNDFDYFGSQFAMRLADAEYNAIEAISSIMQDAGEYSIYTTISQNMENVVTSNETQSIDQTTQEANVLKVLGKVTTISKNEQNIEFNRVAGATNYIAVVEVAGNEYYIDIAQSENILTMDKLLTFMQDGGVPYLEQSVYTISFVAVSNDIHTLANKSVDKYAFEFLKTPVISIIEGEDNIKYLSIANEDVNASNYIIEISQNDSIAGFANEVKSLEADTVVDIDALTKDTITNLPKLTAGNVEIEVKASAIAGNYFNSSNCQLNVVKLDSSPITVVDGLLNWNQIGNAKQYNLTYSNSSGTQTLVLTEGSENFTIQDGKCVYDFVDLIAGTTSFYLQVDAHLQQGETYYLNSNDSETFDIYKMLTPTIKVKSGQIYVEILKADLALSQKIDLKVDNQNGVEILLAGETVKAVSNGIDIDNSNVEFSEVGDKIGVTIDPKALCKYAEVGSEELLLETLTIKAYSKDVNTLNSSMASKEVYGMLSPLNLDIATSINKNENNAIDEVLEKISWNNPSANKPNALELVSKYQIVINYKDVDYIFYAQDGKLSMPTYCDYDANINDELDYSEDADGDGILDDGEDINGNGKLDSVEIVFGAGVYTIKVRALTDNSDKYLNSNYCTEIVVTILEKPNNLSTVDGNVVWSVDTSVGYYIIKVYLLKSEGNGEIKKEVIVSSQSNVSEFDLTKLAPFETGVYGISVQAMHDASKILASKESEILQVIRLPQVEEYYIKDGELYFRIHKLYTKAEITLTDKENGLIKYELPTLYNPKYAETLEEYIVNNSFKNWAESNIIDTYADNEYFIDVKYESDYDSTLRQILAEDYSVSIKLFGSNFSSMDLATLNIGGIISGYTNQPNNKYFNQTNVADKNVIEKLVTPTTEISQTERGVVLVSIQNGLNYNLKYYINGEKSLQGVHLYEVNILTNDNYKLYVAEIVDNELFLASLTAVGSELIQDGEDKNFLKHFEYDGKSFNVAGKDANGFVRFDFNSSYYYYYEPVSAETQLAGGYCNIDLTKGGTFVVNVRFMGDDSIYANSNVTENVTIKRYNVLNLTVKNGEISWLNQATLDDHPIYLISLVGGDNENYNLVLYNPNVEYEPGKNYNEEYLLNCLDKTKTYIFDTINYVATPDTKDEVIVYKGLADIVDRIRLQNGESAGLGGAFLATVKAHYTDISSNDIVLAQGAESKTVAILPQSQISVNKGELTWNMSYVTNTGGREYITNYLLQVFNGTDKLYEIVLSANMYNIASEIATYQLPQLLNNGSDGDFNFTAGSNYTFNLIALGGDSSTYINSVATTTGEINLLPQLTDVRMEDGKLTWSNPTTNSVEIYVSYKVGDAVVVYTTIETGTSFTLPTSFDDANGITRYFINGNEYYIRARLKGGANTLNGFYNDEFGGQVQDEYKIITTRLATTDNASIITSSGVLTWEANEMEGATYKIEYVLEDGTTHIVDKVENPFFNFEGVASGEIKVKIYAQHDKHFTSFASNADERGVVNDDNMVKVFKLSSVSVKSIKYHQGSTIISWDKVQDANGNYVENYRVAIRQDGAEIKEYDCLNSNEWIITGVIGNAFEIAVKAIDVESVGNTINSDYTEYCEMSIPNQVDVITFVFDEEEQAFKWKSILGEQESDIYYLGYHYYENKLTEGSSNAPTEIAEIQITEYKEIDGEKYYYYYPSKIGSYRLIYVQVKRAGSLSSQPTYCKNESGGEFELEFTLFASGCGTSESPYMINNETHLRNIKYFLSAHYELNNNLTLNICEPITKANQIFKGVINGSGHQISSSITASSLTFGSDSDAGYVGLFERVQGATFANIIITGFNVQGTIIKKTSYIGILAGKAEQATFTNVTISSSTINITKNTRTGYTANNSEIYVGEIVGYVENSHFTSCIVSLGGEAPNVIATIEGNAQTKFVLGGIAGYANKCEFAKNTSGDLAYNLTTQLTVASGSTMLPSVYAGALLGEKGDDGVTADASNTLNAMENGNKIQLIGK